MHDPHVYLLYHYLAYLNEANPPLSTEILSLWKKLLKHTSKIVIQKHDNKTFSVLTWELKFGGYVIIVEQNWLHRLK